MRAQNEWPLSVNALVLILLFSFLSNLTLAQELSPQDRTGLVFFFLKSTDWPAETFSGTNAPLILGVFGKNPFGSYAQDFGTNIVRGRRIEVKTFNTVDEVKDCHLLFVSSAETNILARIQGDPQKSNMLTVGETDDFIRDGGLIRIMGLSPGKKYYFEFNKKAYQRSRLRIDPRLLEFGKPVT
jgi:hypothetical protein